MKIIFVIAGLALMACSLVLLAGSIVPHPNEQTSQRLAATWMTNEPTFRFDGIRASLTLTSTVKLRTPYTWDYHYRFDCSHSGYGNRSGKNVLQVITPHIATVRVMRGVVVLAIIDDIWDEVSQAFLTDASLFSIRECIDGSNSIIWIGTNCLASRNPDVTSFQAFLTYGRRQGLLVDMARN